MNNLKFEWDEVKNVINQEKHGISFDEASSVFSDVFARLIPDPEHSHNEERFILMGMSMKYRILTVCHCEKDVDGIRIISARKADKFERQQYEEYDHA